MNIKNICDILNDKINCNTSGCSFNTNFPSGINGGCKENCADVCMGANNGEKEDIRYNKKMKKLDLQIERRIIKKYKEGNLKC